MKHTDIFRHSTDWAELERRITAMPDVKARGDAFEGFCFQSSAVNDELSITSPKFVAAPFADCANSNVSLLPTAQFCSGPQNLICEVETPHIRIIPGNPGDMLLNSRGNK
jgi:hypothetical protein